MPKKSILVHPSCGFCKATEKILAEKIASGEIGVIDAATKEGYTIAKNLGIKGVPDCVEEQDDGTYKVCNLEDLLPSYIPAPVHEPAVVAPVEVKVEPSPEPAPVYEEAPPA
jgi:glutaredoxin